MRDYKQMVILLCLLVFPAQVLAADAAKEAAAKAKQAPAPKAESSPQIGETTAEPARKKKRRRRRKKSPDAAKPTVAD